jgi:hypothetical protein
MGGAIAKSAAIFLVVAAVPVVLAMPVATCRPVGGELPGINCLPAFALAALALRFVARPRHPRARLTAGARRGSWSREGDSNSHDLAVVRF